MGDQAPRSRRSDTSERSRNRAGRRGPRRCRIILYVVGGLLGPGYWLCGSVWDGRPFGKSPAEVHFTEFVLALVVVVVASWGLLLILGEALLFALAVFKADDREQYDIYRNLMILWGYVLTLGIPRHFRKLPAQFEGLADDDAWTGPRSRSQAGPGTRRDAGRHRQNTDHRDTDHHGGERHEGERHGGERHGGERRGSERREGERRGGGRSQERPDARDRAGYREPEYDRTPTRGRDRTQDRRPTRDRDDTRDRLVHRDGENPRDHVGCRDRTQDWPEPWDHEDVRDSAGCRHREHPQTRPTPRDRDNTRDGTGARERAQGRMSSRDREEMRDGEGARPGEGARAGARDRDDTRDRAGPQEREDVRKRSPQGGRSAQRVRGNGGSREAVPGNGGSGEVVPGDGGSREAVPPGEYQGPLGPIFPPRPAAEVEVAPVVPVSAPAVIVPPGALTAQVVATIKGAVPDAELRSALDLLLRYAACLPVEETAPRPTTKGERKPFGIAAEAGGDV